MEEQEVTKELELANRVVGGTGSLLTFKSRDADA